MRRLDLTLLDLTATGGYELGGSHVNSATFFFIEAPHTASAVPTPKTSFWSKLKARHNEQTDGLREIKKNAHLARNKITIPMLWD